MDMLPSNQPSEHFNDLQALLKYDPGGFYGYDKEGSPIFVDPLGQIDFKGTCSYIVYFIHN